MRGSGLLAGERSHNIQFKETTNGYARGEVTTAVPRWARTAAQCAFREGLPCVAPYASAHSDGSSPVGHL